MTGEKHTAARTLLAKEGLSTELVDLLPKAGLVAVISSSGLENLAFALPALVRHLERGKHLVIAQHSAEHAAGLPAPPDLVIARGMAAQAEVESWLEPEGPQRMAAAIRAGAARVQVFDGPTTETHLVETLGLGPEPLLYVQDIQTDPPLPQPHGSGVRREFDLIPANAQAIRRVIDEVGARAILGHCIAADHIEAWKPLAAVCDYTFTIEVERVKGFSEKPVEATIEVFDSDSRIDTYLTTIDTAFTQWRHARPRRNRDPRTGPGPANS